MFHTLRAIVSGWLSDQDSWNKKRGVLTFLMIMILCTQSGYAQSRRTQKSSASSSRTQAGESPSKNPSPSFRQMKDEKDSDVALPGFSSSPSPNAITGERPLVPPYTKDDFGTLPASAATPMKLQSIPLKPVSIASQFTGQEIQTENVEWSVVCGPPTKSTFSLEPQSISLDIRGHQAFQQVESMLLTEKVGGLAMVTWAPVCQSSGQVTWVNVVSLSTGKVISRQFGFGWEAQDISPSGKYVAGMAGDIGTTNHLVVLRINDGSCKPVLLMTPFDDLPENQKSGRHVSIRCIRWLNEHQLLLSSDQQTVVCLDVTRGEILYGIKTSDYSGSPFEITPDRRYILIPQRDICAVFEADTGKQVGILNKADAEHPLETVLSEKMRFSPDGRQMACFSPTNVSLWDFTTGKAVTTYNRIGFVIQCEWLNDQILYTSSGIIDTQKNNLLLMCQQYPQFTDRLGQMFAYMADNPYYPGRSIPTLVIDEPLPSSEVLTRLQEQMEDHNARVMGPGDQISLVVDPESLFSPSEARTIIDYYTKILTENGLKVVLDSQNPEFQLMIFRPKFDKNRKDVIRFRELLSGRTALAMGNSYREAFAVLQNHKPIYFQNRVVRPSPPKDWDGDYQTQVDEEMRMKPDWFLSQSIPKVITKSMSGDSPKGVLFLSVRGITLSKLSGRMSSPTLFDPTPEPHQPDTPSEESTPPSNPINPFESGMKEV